MDKAAFQTSPSGTLVPTERGQWAFVPHDLPPKIDLSKIMLPLNRAARALGELDGIGRVLHDPYLLIRPLQQREALASSSMEGTYTTADDLLLLEAGGSEKGRLPDTREVLNYRQGLANAIDSLTNLPLSIRTLRDAHRTMLTGVQAHRGSRAIPGELKRHQNFIGAYDIEKARFIPPPPQDTQTCLNALEHYWHRDSPNLPALVDSALIHYQFETIHPFADGNGRLGRMLITLHLFHAGELRQPLLYPSPIFEKKKDQYIDLMFHVSKSGAWIEWIDFYLTCIADAAYDAITVADQLLNLQRQYKEMFQKAGKSANLITIIDTIFSHPVFSIPQIAEKIGVTYRAASLNIKDLILKGIIHEIEGASNPKYYVATDILNIIRKSRP